MAADFKPNLSILQGPQHRLWDELVEVPSSFVLCGGTAVALYLGHRTSVDLDFFSREEFDPDQLQGTTSFLTESKAIQKSANTLSCLVERDGTVKLSFFGVPNLKQILNPSVASGNNLRVASLLDLAGMKAAVVQKRAEARDYLDIDAIINQGGLDLPQALSAGKLIYGISFNPLITLKALSYFEDGNLDTLPEDVKNRLAAAVKTVDLERLPELEQDAKQ